MDTIYLNPNTWDLTLDAAGNIAKASVPYALAQDAASAIRTFVGECYYDTTLGVPYWSDILGLTPPLELLRQQFIDAALTVPGVVSAQVYIVSIDRGITGQVQVFDAAGTLATAEF